MSTKQYLIDTEVSFDGEKQTENFIQAQLVSEHDGKAGVEMGLSVIEVIYDDSGKIMHAKDIAKDPPFREDWYDDNVKLGKQFYVDYPVNKPYEFVPDENGLNYLGGEVPDKFVMPKSSSDNTFQYLGLLNHKDPAFSSLLDFDMHLVAPIFTNFYEGLWLDYADPMEPKLMNSDAVHDEYPDYQWKTDSEIVFHKKAFSTQAWPSSSHHGRTGVPVWVQGPEIPVCPKSGETMKLICELSDGHVDSDFRSVIPTTLRHNISFEDQRDRSDSIAKMDFWGMGSLYVFYCPTSKIAHVFIQST